VGQGDRARVYRARSGTGGVIVEGQDPRDYDVEHYARVLRDIFASRLERAFSPEDYAAVFADPDQLTLFAPPIAEVRTVLTPVDTSSGLQYIT
jgi:DNA polymerase, archaea type